MARDPARRIVTDDATAAQAKQARQVQFTDTSLRESLWHEAQLLL